MGRVLPILFNTDMVRAILDGRKTVTRRVVKGFIPEDAIWGYTMFTPKGCISCRGTFADGYGEKFFKLRYQTGDILYVRETFRPLSDHPAAGVEYAADWSPKYFENSKEPNCCNRGKWIPSIHMPKQAARIWLKVTDVRVERLNEITNEQILKEGTSKDAINRLIGQMPEKTEEYIRIAYLTVWSWIWNDTIKIADIERYGREANPWVWVIEFERCEKPEKG